MIKFVVSIDMQQSSKHNIAVFNANHALLTSPVRGNRERCPVAASGILGRHEGRVYRKRIHNVGVNRAIVTMHLPI